MPEVEHGGAGGQGASKRSLGPSYRKVWLASVSSNLGDGISAVGYPWLASAVTRSPLLIALVAVVQRLPWLVFSLPAGVITDRVDRRKLIVRMDMARSATTFGIAVVVLIGGSSLPTPDELASGDVPTRPGLYVALLIATLLLGIAEVLRDNSAQTILPAIVDSDQLERANGRMWSAEMVMNTLIGPPLGSVLVGLAFFAPFAVDGVTFAVAAILVATVPGTFRARGHEGGPPQERAAWHVELREGVRWLWAHPLLRPMAIILGCINALGAMSTAVFVLFAQEILGTGPFTFALLGTGAAAGGILGGWLAERVTRRIGPGPSLWITLFVGGVAPTVTGLLSQWPLVWLVTAVGMFSAVLWNVITVSLRQSIIPDHLLGRVNSVYRFFAWGSIPVGALLGGLITTVADGPLGREWALRLPWLVSGALGFVVLVFAAPKLTTEKIEAARAAG